MANLSQTLERIARERGRDAADRLAPVTVIVPSHAAGIQLRRRLGAMGPFAGVRFETLPRLAEIIAAGSLAAKGRSPLARPIGDYLAAKVALEARSELAEVRELPGFGRVLRQLFRRIRRAGIQRPKQVRVALSNGYMGELMRLYGLFRQEAASFYDEEDLLDEASTVLPEGRSALAAELGSVYVVPPGALSAGADALLRALRRACERYVTIDESAGRPDESFVLASDPASEVREAVREVVTYLDNGSGLHEIAVLHGGDPSYRKLLREAFAAASIPAAIMPGTPLNEIAAGRSVLALAALPAEDYSRTAVMDFLAVAPLKDKIPGRGASLAPQPAAWDRLSREAGITKRGERWRSALDAFAADKMAELRRHELEADERRRFAIEREIERAGQLRGVIEALIERLDPLATAQPAAAFIERFAAVVDDYISPKAPGLAEIKAEIDQLGTVAAVGGSFGLPSFVQALRANLEIASLRERGLGEGVFVADYRLAAGLQFKQVVLCGAFEGSFPARPGGDTLVDDAEWARLRERFPFIEDATLRIERAGQAAARAVAAAGGGSLVWMAPLYEPGGTREYYPSPAMAQAAAAYEPSITTASELRRAPAGERLRRSASPLAAALRGRAAAKGEAALRRAVADRRDGVTPSAGDRLYQALLLLRSRRNKVLGEYDGDVSALAQAGKLWTARSASPTSLEAYAACGFQYLCSHVLRLRVAEEPEERELMDPADRGSLMHEVLDAFFKEKVLEGRPGPGEPWRPADLARLLEIANHKLDEAKQRGRTGLDIFAEHDSQTILADLAAFLEEDSVFRLETGAIPKRFEVDIPPAEVSGIAMRGKVDRIDETPDGRHAWVIDYKTGSAAPYRALNELDPLMSGTKLQLPAYVSAAGGAEDVQALYWFISRKGEFKRVAYQPTPANQARFEATVKAIVDGIAQGAFPAVPGEEDEYYGTWSNCRYCDFDRICSRGREQDFDLKSASASMTPWLKVGETARELRQ